MNTEYLDFAKRFAWEAGKIMLKYYSEDFYATYKQSDNTIVTLADTEINHLLIARVKEAYPTHSVIGEEESFGKSSINWVCDPLDGTYMYSKHIPVSVFSLALVVDGSPQIGVVFDPFFDNMYSAAKGEGALKNSERIIVNDSALEDKGSVANFEMWPSAPFDVYKLVSELGKKMHFVNIGSIIRASMAVASGDFTMAVFPGVNCCHDIAAVKIIVEEAGGKVTDVFGNEQRYDRDITGAVISNGLVHDEVVRYTRKYFQ